jgi:hypothetical protein
MQRVPIEKKPMFARDVAKDGARELAHTIAGISSPRIAGQRAIP